MSLRRILLAALAVVVVLLAVVALRAARMESRQPAVEPTPALLLDTAAVVARLAQGIRFPTVSWDDTVRWRPEPFDALHAHLAASFPMVHATLRRETVAGHSLLYEWTGRDASLPPVLLLAHQDVVPPGGAPEQWTHPPFSGAVADGFVWGRGTLDVKSSLFAMLEATELLLAQGFQPQRTLLFAFGHDEEIGGGGARAMAALLGARGVQPALVLDEGGFLTTGVFPVARPVAAVGVAEKGYLSVELVADVAGGHSSRPTGESSIGALTAALQRLERAPFPARLQGVTRETLAHLAPEMSFAQRLALGNLWLFRPVVERQLVASPTTAALLRTTMVPTIIDGGDKDNVIPPRATAVVNLRTMPGVSNDAVLRRISAIVDDRRITVRPFGAWQVEASPVSPVDAAAFALVRDAIRGVYPDAIVTPYLVIGGTDARHYTALSTHVYRFAPLRLTPPDVERIHGIDERIAISDYVDGIRFYRALVERVASSRRN